MLMDAPRRLVGELQDSGGDLVAGLQAALAQQPLVPKRAADAYWRHDAVVEECERCLALIDQGTLQLSVPAQQLAASFAAAHAVAAFNLSQWHLARGEPPTAIVYLQRARQSLQRPGVDAAIDASGADQGLRLKTLAHLGPLLCGEGLISDAVEPLREGAAAAAAAGDGRVERALLDRLVPSLTLTGDPAGAVETGRTLLSKLQALPEPSAMELARVRVHVATATATLHARGDPRAGERPADEAHALLDAAEVGAEGKLRCALLDARGRVLQLQGQHAAALATHRRLIDVASQMQRGEGINLATFAGENPLAKAHLSVARCLRRCVPDDDDAAAMRARSDAAAARA